MNLSPDGNFYLRAAAGLPVPRPYNRRWLLARMLGPNPRRWAQCTHASLALTPGAAWLFFGAMGLGGAERLFAVALLCALPGVRACSLRFPVLLDAPSFLVALLLAWAACAAPWWVVLSLALLGGATRETVPVFAALWSWSPWPLVGLLAVGWTRPAARTDIPWLTHPVREALALRRALGWDGVLYLRPFGAALAGLVGCSWQCAATCAVAAAQLLAAQDTIRLTVWAGPVLVLGAAKVIPAAWWPLAVVWTLVHQDERV